MLDPQPAASVVGDCFFCHGQCSTVLRVAGEGKTTGRDHVWLLIYCTPCSTVPSTSAVGLGEMSSGRQQAAELDQAPVLY